MEALGDSGTTLTSLYRTPGARYSREANAIRLPDGRRIRIAAGRIDGFLEELNDFGQKFQVSGWAAAGARPVTRVLLFDGNRFLKAVDTTLPRKDLARRLGSNFNRFGFSLTVPYYALERPAGIAAFGLSGSVATRLAPLCKSTGVRLDGC